MFKFIEPIIIFIMGILCGFIILNKYGGIKQLPIIPTEYKEVSYGQLR